MPMTPSDDLAARVRAALLDPNEPLWLPGITSGLVDAGWSKLGRDLHLTRSSYGTARVLRGDPKETRRYVAYVEVPLHDRAGHHAIPIELLPEDIAQQWAGVRFFGAQEIVEGGVGARAAEALEILAVVPRLLSTVCSLIRSLHAIDSADDEVDVSFSSPDLPFSVFVSVPK